MARDLAKRALANCPAMIASFAAYFLDYCTSFCFCETSRAIIVFAFTLTPIELSGQFILPKE
jgi:hypothetical protein